MEQPAQTATPARSKRRWPILRLLRRLGPGLVAGAADDDPSGVAVYSQSGAAFGFAQLWSMLYSIPLMIAVQELAARIGRVTGKGIAGNLRRHYPYWISYPLVFLFVLANTATLGADLGAMGDATTLVVGGPAVLYCILFAVGSLYLQVFVHYERYSAYLKWLTLVLFAYVIVGTMVEIPWRQVTWQTFVPQLSTSGEYWSILVGVMGTTIAPYVFFWQASQETEEVRVQPGEEPLLKQPEQAREQLVRIRFDTNIGMVFSNVISFFIMLAAAATLHARGVKDIQTAAQAAQALGPVAGPLSSLLFALGIIGTGLVALPVMAGGIAYAVGEMLRIPVGLAQRPKQAKGFYGVMATATVLGIAINLPWVQHALGLTPLKALFWACVVDGVVAVPVMALIMHMSSNQKVMGQFARLSSWLRVVGWLATAVMAAMTVAMLLFFSLSLAGRGPGRG